MSFHKYGEMEPDNMEKEDSTVLLSASQTFQGIPSLIPLSPLSSLEVFL